MKDGNLKPGLSYRFYPWYCLAIRVERNRLGRLTGNAGLSEFADVAVSQADPGSEESATR